LLHRRNDGASKTKNKKGESGAAQKISLLRQLNLVGRAGYLPVLTAISGKA
jgi:hypothetical protein